MSLSNNIKNMVQEAGVSYWETARSIIFTCPRCSKSDKVWILKSNGKFRCWYCISKSGYGGKGEYLLADLTNKPVWQCKDELYGGEALNLDIDWEVEFEVPEDVDMLVYQWPHDYYPLDHKWAKRGADYLAGRGIPPEIAKLYDIRYCPPLRSVAFPIKSGELLLGWQERLVVPHEVTVDDVLYKTNKSKTADGVLKDRLLMFQNSIKGRSVALTEGPITSLKFHLAGGHVCTMGKEVSPTQFKLLKTLGVKTIYMALDADARKEADRFVQEYCLDFDFMDMVPETGDWGERTMEEVLTAYKKAEPYRLGGLSVDFG